MCYGKRHCKAEKSVHDSDPSVCGHTLVGRYGGHLRHAHEIDHEGQEREVQDESGCRNPRRVNRHLVVYEPQSNRLCQDNDDHGKCQLDDDRSRVDLCLLGFRSFAKLKSYETLDG